MTKVSITKQKIFLAVIAVAAVGCIKRGLRSLDSKANEVSAEQRLIPFQSKEITVFDVMSIARQMQQSTPSGSLVSMDDFLGKLKAHPKGLELFSNFTAAFYSRAEQEASPQYPRVIMTTESGSFTATFNYGDLPGNHQLEMNQVHPETHERMLFSLDFPLKGGAVLGELKKNPESCTACHYSNRLGVQHLWGRYPKWEGVIGGEDDFIAPQVGEYIRNIPGCEPDPSKKEKATPAIVKEYEVLQHLRSMAENGHPRYRHLDFPKGAPKTYPYSSDPKGFVANRPNFRFGGVWHRHHVLNFIHETKKAKKYDDYAKMHLYGFFSCSAVVSPVVDQMVRNKYGILDVGSDADTAWMQAAMALMGMELVDLSLNENPEKFEKKIGYSPGSERSILLLARLILEEDAAVARRLPHHTYELVAPNECQAIYDHQKFPSLRNFGYKPTLRQSQSGKTDSLMCDVIASEMLGDQIGVQQRNPK